jgi:hypothetical protein
MDDGSLMTISWGHIPVSIQNVLGCPSIAFPGGNSSSWQLDEATDAPALASALLLAVLIARVPLCTCR